MRGAGSSCAWSLGSTFKRFSGQAKQDFVTDNRKSLVKQTPNPISLVTFPRGDTNKCQFIPDRAPMTDQRNHSARV